jgi:hypothetical protein
VLAMKLSDRLRRWWSPARWADDHPLEAKEHKGDIRLTNIVGRSLEAGASTKGLVKSEQDFKKPR